ncbi:type 1 fimbrial major subunit FimA [Serratia marcescens]
MLNKQRVIKSVLAAALLSAGTMATAATTTVNGGTVHFKGEVVNAACAVDAGSVDQTVQLGQVKTATLNEAGKTSSAVGFNIQLNDCDTSVATKAAIAFSGVAVDAENTNALALESSSAGGATNVGVQVLDSTGKALAFDGATYSTAATLSDGNNTLPFQARYIATGAATPGAANANANFKVQYE